MGGAEPGRELFFFSGERSALAECVIILTETVEPWRRHLCSSLNSMMPEPSASKSSNIESM